MEHFSPKSSGGPLFDPLTMDKLYELARKVDDVIFPIEQVYMPPIPIQAITDRILPHYINQVIPEYKFPAIENFKFGLKAFKEVMNRDLNSAPELGHLADAWQAVAMSIGRNARGEVQVAMTMDFAKSIKIKDLGRSIYTGIIPSKPVIKKVKLPRKAKKAYIKSNSRDAYHACYGKVKSYSWSPAVI